MMNSYKNQATIDFYKKNRAVIKDLYKSEKKFFIEAVKNSNSFTDFGCNIGNFINIISEIKFQYWGYDNEKKFIDIGKSKYPGQQFKQIKNYTDIKKKSDFVFSLGTIHNIKNWEKYIIALKKITKKYLLFDVRLTKEKTVNNNLQFQKILFDSKWDGISKVRYVTINEEEFKLFLKKNFKNFKIRIQKYKKDVGKGYVGKYNKVYMTTIFCKKIYK